MEYRISNIIHFTMTTTTTTTIFIFPHHGMYACLVAHSRLPPTQTLTFHHRHQAPIKKRTTARAKSARAARPVPAALPTPTDGPASAAASSKRDRLKSKHASFVSKIEKSSASAPKRRRPNKQLVANLESLADALPTEDAVELDQATISRKSLKSRPGAMKRKEKLNKAEMQRFNQNLVQLAGTGAGTAVDDRWAALKSHVQRTMEVKPEFATQ
jgi:hypothetical protein